MANDPKIEIRGSVMTVSFDQNTCMVRLNEYMQLVHEAMEREMCFISKELNVSIETAGSIQYLRTRSRWTQEQEDMLIEADHAGKPVDHNLILSGDWPTNEN